MSYFLGGGVIITRKLNHGGRQLNYLNNTLPLNLVAQRKDDRSWSKATSL